MAKFKMTCEIVAAKTRMLRKEAGLTQEGLALRAEVNIETVKRIEKIHPNTKLSSLDAVAKALGLETWELIHP